MSTLDLRDLRREYAKAGLHEDELDPNPFVQFQRWYQDIDRPETLDANAMIVATVDSLGQPRQRTVLLKEVDDNGFIFFSNYESAKGQDIASNPQVSILFAWHVLERQVIIQGQAERVENAVSESYFASRPVGSQIAAAISQQSATVENRDVLEASYQELEQKLDGSMPERPEHWGGYRVVPQQFEFWQGRSNRLHDRLIYTRQPGGWAVGRLQP